MSHRRTRFARFCCCTLAGLFMAAAPSHALAADDVTKTVVFLGVSGLQSKELRNEIQAGVHLGFTASLASHLSDWFGIVGEVGGNYEIIEFSDQSRFHSRFVTMTAGPTIFRRVGWVTPFAQVLVGLAVLGGDRSQNFKGTQGGFAVQPGLGLDVWVSNNVGLRAEVDYRRLRTDNSRDDQYRASLGFVVGW